MNDQHPNTLEATNNNSVDKLPSNNERYCSSEKDKKERGRRVIALTAVRGKGEIRWATLRFTAVSIGGSRPNTSQASAAAPS